MAKLPKAKSKAPDSDDITVTPPTSTVDADTESLKDEDQSDALSGVIESAAQTAQTAETDTEREASETITEETEEVDSGENPETAPPENGIVMAPPKKSTPKATTVKVATVCDHSCYIGGVPYHFKQGVVTYVPAPVKDILRRAGLLQAL